MTQDCGYRERSGVLQVVMRLEQSAREDKALAQKLGRITRGVSSVVSSAPLFVESPAHNLGGARWQ